MVKAEAGRTAIGVVADLVAPPRCVLCDRGRTHLCHTCAATLAPPPRIPAPAGVDHLVALCAYDRAGRDLVLGIKRRNRLGAIGLLGGALADALTAIGRPLTPTGTGVVTWAPTTRRRRRSRGFDQAQLLACSVATAAGLPCRPLLRRTSGDLVGANKAERLRGVSFELCGQVGAEVVLVDDVVTTGATMSAAAAALRAGGARRITAAALARALNQEVTVHV